MWLHELESVKKEHAEHYFLNFLPSITSWRKLRKPREQRGWGFSGDRNVGRHVIMFHVIIRSLHRPRPLWRNWFVMKSLHPNVFLCRVVISSDNMKLHQDILLEYSASDDASSGDSGNRDVRSFPPTRGAEQTANTAASFERKKETFASHNTSHFSPLDTTMLRISSTNKPTAPMISSTQPKHYSWTVCQPIDELTSNIFSLLQTGQPPMELWHQTLPNNTGFGDIWRTYIKHFHPNSSPYLSNVPPSQQISLMAAFAAFIRQGLYKQRPTRVGCETVKVALRAISTTFALVGKPNPLVTAQGRYHLSLDRQLKHYKKQDPAPKPPQLALPVAAIHFIRQRGLQANSAKAQAMADLCIVAWFYLLHACHSLPGSFKVDFFFFLYDFC